ncbi:hypothetical protein [Streptomyces sp. NPDC056399]|uniref:hypothetical protein n=1 Tax=Streptomyces sp. NPDC056399 TaxID=3345807 RepID=UPI0035DB2CB0
MSAYDRWLHAMIAPMTTGWGRAIGGVVLAVAAVSGCGGSNGEDNAAKPSASAPAIAAAPSVAEAVSAFQEAVVKFDVDGGCLDKAPDTCWAQMQAVMEPARELRKAANADEAGPAFWSEAYVLIDAMEQGIATGKDLGAEDPATNRPHVLGSAHKLSRWLDAHSAS